MMGINVFETKYCGLHRASLLPFFKIPKAQHKQTINQVKEGPVIELSLKPPPHVTFEETEEPEW